MSNAREFESISEVYCGDIWVLMASIGKSEHRAPEVIYGVNVCTCMGMIFASYVPLI